MTWRAFTGKWRLPYPNTHPFAIIKLVVEKGNRPELDNSMPPLLTKVKKKRIKKKL
jgi:hypothetical protein